MRGRDYLGGYRKYSLQKISLGDESEGCNNSKTELTYMWMSITKAKEESRIHEVHDLKVPCVQKGTTVLKMGRCEAGK